MIKYKRLCGLMDELMVDEKGDPRKSSICIDRDDAVQLALYHNELIKRLSTIKRHIRERKQHESS